MRPLAALKKKRPRSQRTKTTIAMVSMVPGFEEHASVAQIAPQGWEGQSNTTLNTRRPSGPNCFAAYLGT
jgi:hypothetical protein